MNKRFGLVLALVAGFAFGVQAQAEHHHEGDGHDHSKDGHTHATKKASDENTLEYFWRKSDEAFHAGDYERAVGLHKGIVALDPTDIESFGVASWLMWSMGKKDEALAHIDRGLRANEDNWHMWDTAGQQYDLQKRETPALAANAKTAYARSVQLLPVDANKNEAQMLRRRLAHAAEKADDLALSVATWRDLVRDYPDDVVNKNNLARVEKTMAESKRSAANTLVPGAGNPLAFSGLALLVMTGAGAILRRRAPHSQHFL